MNRYMELKDRFYETFPEHRHSLFRRFTLWKSMTPGKWYHMEDIPAFNRFKPRSVQKVILMRCFVADNSGNRPKYRRKEIDEAKEEKK